MENKIKKLIQLNVIRDIQIAMLRKKEKGLTINEEEMDEILFGIEATSRERSEEVEIDEGGEDLEDEEKIADAVDTEDLGAKADMEWEKEKDERLGL